MNLADRLMLLAHIISAVRAQPTNQGVAERHRVSRTADSTTRRSSTIPANSPA
jgi:hypothetical protein